MGCQQDLHIFDSQQEIGLAASPYMYYVIIYPVRNAPSLNKGLQYKETSPLLQPLSKPVGSVY